MQEIQRAWDRSSGKIVPSQRTGQSPIGRERTTYPIETAGPAPSGAKMRSRVVDIRKVFDQVAAENPRTCLNGMSWNPATIHQPVPTRSQYLIFGDSLLKDLTDIHVVGQATAISFGGATVAQVIKMIELQNVDRVDTLILMKGFNEVFRHLVTTEEKWEPLLVCLLNELKEKYRPRLVALCNTLLSPDAGSPIADFMNGNVTRWNTMARNLIADNSNELK